MTLYVSRPARTDKVTVPDLTGIVSTSSVSKVLDPLRLLLGTVTTVENTAAGGTVVTQDPVPGTQVPVGTKINISISSGYVTPVTKNIAVTIIFDKNVPNGHWTASFPGGESAFDVTKENRTWTFTAVGTTGTGNINLSNGQSLELNFDSETAKTFEIKGTEPTATPTPTAAPTATPTATPTAVPSSEPTATPVASPAP